MFSKIGRLIIWGGVIGAIYALPDAWSCYTESQYYCTAILVCGLLGVACGVNVCGLTLKKIFNFTLLKGCFLIGSTQVLYGILQYYEVIKSTNTDFRSVGRFDNPAGYSVMLSLLFPIGIYWLLHVTRRYRYGIGALLVLYVLAVILSGSRAGVLSMGGSMCVLLWMEYPNFRKFLSRKVIVWWLFVFIIGIGVGLYIISRPLKSHPL